MQQLSTWSNTMLWVIFFALLALRLPHTAMF